MSTEIESTQSEVKVYHWPILKHIRSENNRNGDQISQSTVQGIGLVLAAVIAIWVGTVILTKWFKTKETESADGEANQQTI